MIKLKLFLKSAIAVSLLSAILFISAGRIDYIQGWIYYFLSIFSLWTSMFLIRNNEQLMNERSNPGSNTKDWDKRILGLLLIFAIIAYVSAGLDTGRFHFSDSLHFGYIIIGSIFIIIGQTIFIIAKSQNNYFSSVARIQTERDHKVCDIGLYKIIRHPGYLGMIVSWIGFPFVMCSLFSIIPVFISIVLLIVRTIYEDKMLYNELIGYAIYSNETRYKLIPLIW